MSHNPKKNASFEQISRAQQSSSVQEIICNLRKEMQKQLGEHRFDHTLGVAYTAASMSFVWGTDLTQTVTAGMLHDCAKHISHDDAIQLCKRYGIVLSEFELRNPSLIHAVLGAALANVQYGVNDDEVLNAIRYHTTGRPGMTTLEKIIYIADYIEPNRNNLPGLKEVRKEAFTDLDVCLYHILKGITAYLEENGQETDPITKETCAYYEREVHGRKN